MRLGKANREYQSKHLTLRKRMLSVVATLGASINNPSGMHVHTYHHLTPQYTTPNPATSSFLGWLACALLTQRFPLGAIFILPASLLVAIYAFPRYSGEEGSLLELAWS